MSGFGPPEGIDIRQPSVARMYDYYLGGTHNYASDRAAVAAVQESLPDIFERVIEGRAFLRRVLRYMCSQGIDQFIDIGSGLPSADNTHDIVQRATRGSRVIYCDIDRLAVIHGRDMLKENNKVAFIQGSALELQAILDHPETTGLIDFSRPVGVVMMGLFHFFSVDECQQVLEKLRKELQLGSLVGISHGNGDALSAHTSSQLRDTYSTTSNFLYTRTWEKIHRILEGFELVAPGLVEVHDWKMEQSEITELRPVITHAWYGAVCSICKPYRM